jgi:inhibitor of the pro-sigma K processing machinery
MVVLSQIASEILIIIGALLIVYIVFKLGKLLAGIVINIILGFVSLFLVNALLGMNIPFDLVVIVITAILGLPGVALIVLLKFFGITL